jgi:transcriptional regulator with XRE-family HTH domain
MKHSPRRRKFASVSGESSYQPTHPTLEIAPTTTLQITAPSDTIAPDNLALSARVYFRERFRNRLYDLIIGELELFKSKGFTQAQLARRLNKRPDQISRWLSGPGNMTLDTVSDLLLGLSGGELSMLVDIVTNQPPRTVRGPQWLELALASCESTRVETQNKTRAISDASSVITLDISPSVTTIAAPVSLSVGYEMAVVG